MRRALFRLRCRCPNRFAMRPKLFRFVRVPRRQDLLNTMPTRPIAFWKCGNRRCRRFPHSAFARIKYRQATYRLYRNRRREGRPCACRTRLRKVCFLLRPNSLQNNTLRHSRCTCAKPPVYKCAPYHVFRRGLRAAPKK